MMNDEKGDTTWYTKTASVFVCLLLILTGGSECGEEIKFHGYDFEQIVSTTVYSLTEETNCSRDETKPQLVKCGAVLFNANNREQKLRTCHFQASYTVSYMKKSTVYDDALYLHEKSKILPTFYLLPIETCRLIWNEKRFTLPGFGKKAFRLTQKDLEFVKNSESENFKTFDFSATFMKASGKGIGYTTPVEWTTPLGETIKGSVMINGRLTIGNIITERQQKGSEFFEWLDPLGNQQTRKNVTNDFEQDFVDYLWDGTSSCDWLTLVPFSEPEEVHILKGQKQSLLTGFVNSAGHREFALEFSNSAILICNRTVHPTSVENVFVTFELTDFPKKGGGKINSEMFQQSKLDFLYARSLNETAEIWKQLEFQQCQIDSMEKKLKSNLIANIDSMVLGEEMKGRHIERAGEVLYIHRCAKMEVTLVTNTFCTEEVPVRLGHANETVVKYMNPVSRVFYSNYTLAECNPVYPNLVRINNGSWVTYGTRIELARVVPSSYNNGSRPGLRPHEFVGLMGNGLFTLEDLMLSNQARALKHSRTTVVGREVYRGSAGNYLHENFFHLNFPDRQLGFSWGVVKCFQTVKQETLRGWWMAREIALTLLTLTLIGTLFRFVIKVFFVLRLKNLGTTARVAMQPLNPFYEYNQILMDVKLLRDSKNRNEDCVTEESITPA